MVFFFSNPIITLLSSESINSKGFNMKITEQKNGDYTTFERVSHNGYYIVKLYKNGNLADKVMTDTYRAARDYLRSFNLIAKNG
jgi:hypothetical protein